MTDTSNAAITWLTQDQYDRLQAELDHLSGPGRTEIAKKIDLARQEGDLSENGGYHAAREEQGKAEARIRQLIQLLRNAQVGEPPAAAAGVAGPGMVVELRWQGDSDTEKVLLGSRDRAETDLEIYSAVSPLGKAVTGKRPGERATFTAPTGKELSVEIVSVERYAG